MPSDRAEHGAQLPRWYTQFVQLAIESEEHTVTMEPAEEYGWLICVDGERVLPGRSSHGLPWENLTLGNDWKHRLTEEQYERLSGLMEGFDDE